MNEAKTQQSNLYGDAAQDITAINHMSELGRHLMDKVHEMAVINCNDDKQLIKEFLKFGRELNAAHNYVP